MIVLSLFDGVSCGFQTLKNLKVPVTKYYSSEINPHSMKVSFKNHPEVIQLGGIENWKKWDIETPDLIIGGSPCQGFSFAGKQLAFSDPRSSLFFTMCDIINHYKPRFKFLENVRMKKEFLDVITNYMGVAPHFINSALVSAQNRQRYYWYNWVAKDPEDKGIVLTDILESHLPSCGIGARIVGRRLNDEGIREDYNSSIKIKQYLEQRFDGKANCLTTVYKDSVCPVFKCDKRLEIKFNQTKASCLTGGGNSGGNHSDMDILCIVPEVVRRYSPIECERLQGLPDNYTEGVSLTQRYKMLGDCWNIPTIEHIFKSLFKDET